MRYWKLPKKEYLEEYIDEMLKEDMDILFYLENCLVPWDRENHLKHLEGYKE